MTAAAVSVLPVPVAISNKKRSPPFPYRLLQRMDRSELVGTQKAQIVGLNEAGALGFILPRSFRGIMRPVGESDVIFANLFRDQALRVGRDLSVAGYRVRRREGGDDIGVAAFQIPEVMQIAVRQDDEAAILGAGVFACLLLADERVLVLRLGFQDDQGEPLGVEEQEVDEPGGDFLEVITQRVQVVRALIVTPGSRQILAGLSPSAKKRHPEASSSLLILIRAVASFMGTRSLCW